MRWALLLNFFFFIEEAQIENFSFHTANFNFSDQQNKNRSQYLIGIRSSILEVAGLETIEQAFRLVGL